MADRTPTPPRIVAIALGSAIAPFVVQTATRVLTQSVASTLVAGALLAALFIAAALAFQARLAGSLRAVPWGARIGTALAILTYHVIAFPVAQIANALFFAPRP